MLYPLLYKGNNTTSKIRGRKGRMVGKKINLCVRFFTKHSLQLRDPTQTDDACEATGSPLQIHHALLGVLRTVTRPPDYNVV